LSCMGGGVFWALFALIFGGAKVSDVAQTAWLGYWARECELYSLSFLERAD